MTEQDDHQDVHGVRVMLLKLFDHEEHGHEEDSGGVFFLEKGTGVCLGATERNGKLENRHREVPRL